MVLENILVVEDDEDIKELLRYNLDKEGYRIRVCGSGEEALSAVAFQIPDLVILDLMLPGIDGLEVCRRLKSDRSTQKVPIVMLTAKGEVADIVVGLELGADDYVTKPVSPRVLIARIKAVLRRNADVISEEQQVLQIQDIIIRPERHEVTIDNQAIELTVSEFKLLTYLARRPGWVFTRRQIVSEIHGDDYPVTDRSVDVVVVGLRDKLGEASNCIETVRGVGYRIRENN